MSSNLYLCIHGHFYQPPRENPWLEVIEHQESAAPYHDWNERISAECYRPNGLSQILDDKNWVTKLSNNYSRMSFNFGATLLSWLEVHDPQTYESILEGDRKSLARFGGHGSAIAQGYNHTIFPLSNRRDKETQIKWGLYDFEKRFKRPAEAMWLPETAVDTETLEIMADHGLRYVILAPRQAQAVRPLGGEHVWQSVRGEKIDTHKPYLINLPNNKSIAAFFYDGVISRAVAFEGLLNNGEIFADRLYRGFDASAQPQILHIATDGESYGHHHLRGDMALAYAMHHIEKKKMATLTNYGQFLSLFPPVDEVQIHENSSWSCIHGIERWRSDCGCNSGMRSGWHQKWRRPLREAMDFLRDELAPCFEQALEDIADPWAMRNEYVTVILDRSDASREAFLHKWLPIKERGNSETENRVLKAMEMQRQLLLMYSSCAWFFDEISGVETVQALQYAARAIELSKELCDTDVESDFLRILDTAPSNIPEFINGRHIYEMFVRPARVDFLKVATHLATNALFEDEKKTGSFASFNYEWLTLHRIHAGRSQLIVGHILITSTITQESRQKEVVCIHLGDHNMNVGALPFSTKESFEQMSQEFMSVFNQGDLPKSLRLLDKYFEGNIYYLNDLLHDQQKEIINQVFSRTLETLEEQFSNIYHQHYPVMTYFSKSHIALPQVFSHIAHFVQNKHIKNQLNEELPNFDEIKRYVHEAESWKVNLDIANIEILYLNALEKFLTRCRKHPQNLEYLKQFQRLVELKKTLPFELNLEKVQSLFALWVHRLPSVDDVQEAAERNILIEDIAKTLKVRLNDRAVYE